MYGAQPNKLAKMLRISDKESKRLFELYWEGVPALTQLKSKVESFWEQTNKEYILSIDKRKLLVRSKHSVVNLLFQSTGALIMKYTTIEMCKRLDALGLLGDPLKDSADSKKVFLMIVYHDELQVSCHPSMFDILKFDNEEDAETYAKLTSKSGSSSHVGDEYWAAPESVLSKLVDDSVKHVNDMFKLRVNLGVEWKVGTNWGDTH